MSRGPGAAQRFVLDRLAQEQERAPGSDGSTRRLQPATAPAKRPPPPRRKASAAPSALARDGTVETKAGLWSSAPRPSPPDGGGGRPTRPTRSARSSASGSGRPLFGYASYAEMVAADEAENRG